LEVWLNGREGIPRIRHREGKGVEREEFVREERGVVLINSGK